jgi:hypothetical protein
MECSASTEAVMACQSLHLIFPGQQPVGKSINMHSTFVRRMAEGPNRQQPQQGKGMEEQYNYFFCIRPCVQR